MVFNIGCLKWGCLKVGCLKRWCWKVAETAEYLGRKHRFLRSACQFEKSMYCTEPKCGYPFKTVYMTEGVFIRQTDCIVTMFLQWRTLSKSCFNKDAIYFSESFYLSLNMADHFQIVAQHWYDILFRGHKTDYWYKMQRKYVNLFARHLVTVPSSSRRGHDSRLEPGAYKKLTWSSDF